MNTPAQSAKRRAGRPTAPLLDSAVISQAALQLIITHGYSRLTVAAIAKHLGVSPSALYNHISSKEEVLAMVQDSLMSSVDVDVFDALPFRAAAKAWARSYRDVFSAHLPLIPVIAIQPVRNSPQTVQFYERVVSGFARAGWPASSIIDAIAAVEAYIFGSAYDVNAPSDIFDADPTTAPTLSSALAARGGGGYTSERSFELGLDALVDGLAAAHGVGD